MLVLVIVLVIVIGLRIEDETLSEEDTWKVVLFLSNMKSLPPTVRSEWEGNAKN